MRPILPILTLCFSLLTASGATSSKPAPPANLPPAIKGPVDFVRDIQPLFAARCYSCHGAETQQHGLRLDHKPDALVGGDDGRVILPGNSAASRLIHYVAGLAPEKRMPRKGTPLTAHEIGTLRAWIDAGAPWPDSAAGTPRRTSAHWSFTAPRRPAVPAVSNAAWIRNPIDHFILARLEKSGLTPSPEADRHTLLRRLCLDLTGLPPSPEQLRQFLADTSAKACENLVERLLESPHYGERWARHWLDLAHYADSDGYEKDSPRPYAYVYRNWVIRSLNRDQPFDQFTHEQLAGDLLPNATTEQKLGTGFLRQTLTNKEGGVDQEEFRCRAIVDRVGTLGSVWLGLTLACAECHAHKYDPFSQRDFYQLYAFFNDASERDLPAPQPAELNRYQAAKSAWDSENSRLQTALTNHLARVQPARLAAWEEGVRKHHGQWSLLEPAKLTSANGTTLRAGGDRIVEATGANPATDTYTVEFTTELKAITGFRLEVFPDTGKTKTVGRSTSGNFVLAGFSAKLVPRNGPSQPVALQNANSDFAQGKYTAARAIDGSLDTGWAVLPQTKVSHSAVFETRADLNVPAGTRLVITLDQRHGTSHTIARFRLSTTTSPRPLQADPTPDTIAALVQIPAPRRTPAQTAQLQTYFRDQLDLDLRKLNETIRLHATREPKPPTTTAAVLLREDKPRKTHIHVRGDFLRPGAEVSPDTPAILPALKSRAIRPDRLDLARWLTDPTHPLTTRVTANHYWKHLLGRPLVKTENDFGTRGEPPTHPELLDWLATELPRLGWSRKAFIKLIVTSATYRQSSNHRPELESTDPLNTLLARQNRFRLEAESIRDASLAVSGLLAPTIGGPSVYPPLPRDIPALGYASSLTWPLSTGPDRYRRGLYIFFQRTVPYPMLTTFDAPDSNAPCTRRDRSNTPLQSLTLLNDPVFFECAQALGIRMHTLAPTAPDRIRLAFERALGRPPDATELSRLAALYESQFTLLSSDPERAARILGTNKVHADAAQAACVIVARVLLNLDEFLTRE